MSQPTTNTLPIVTTVNFNVVRLCKTRRCRRFRDLWKLTTVYFDRKVKLFIGFAKDASVCQVLFFFHTLAKHTVFFIILILKFFFLSKLDKYYTGLQGSVAGQLEVISEVIFCDKSDFNRRINHHGKTFRYLWLFNRKMDFFGFTGAHCEEK